MREPIDLGYAASLSPELAIDYFRAKGYEITWNWQDASVATHAKAFTVAKAARLDVLQSIRTEVDNALSNGITERDFIKRLKPTLQKQGWWGEQVIVDNTGNAEVVKLGSPARLKTIYRTNLATAYQAGRYQQQLDQSETHPYWQYVAIIDSNTRTSHAAMHGKVFRYDDPIWDKLYPPNDWGCRCRIRALTEAQVERMGVKVENSRGLMSTKTIETGTNKHTGEIYTSEVTQFKQAGKALQTGAGWSYNPGSVAMGSDLQIARKLLSLQNRNLRQDVIQSLNNSNIRQTAYSNWIKNIMQSRRAGNDVQPIGFMQDDIVKKIEDKTGAPVSNLLGMSGKRVLHVDSPRHQRDGVGLSESELFSLPQLLQSPKVVLFDTQERGIIYILENSIKVVTDTVTAKKQPDLLQHVITSYKVNLNDIRKDIKGGRYEVIHGQI